MNSGNTVILPRTSIYLVNYSVLYNSKLIVYHCWDLCNIGITGVAICRELRIKVGISGYGNLRTMSTDKWATSKSTQLSTKVWVKLLLLLEDALAKTQIK